MDSARLSAWLRTGFVVLVLLAAIFAVWSAEDFRRAARLFPQYGGAALALLCAFELLRQFLRRKLLTLSEGALNTADIGLEADETSLEGWKRSLVMMGWVFGYMLLIWLLGMALATAVFVPALLILRFRAPVYTALVLVAGLWGLMWALRGALNLRLPSGVLAGSFPF